MMMLMKVMSKIDEIWSKLEAEGGVVTRLYPEKSKYEPVVGLKGIEGNRFIGFLLSPSFSFEEKRWNKIKSVKIETYPHQKSNILRIVLLKKDHQEIFSTLCEDLINYVRHISEESILVESLLGRLEKWQMLFEKTNRQGLSLSEQRGLYGEVYFLKLFLEKTRDKGSCVDSWMGPEKSVQDFQYSNWAVEVKTTQGKNHQKIHIASERQLDDSLVKNIVLYHLSLDSRQGSGESLNSVIDQVYDSLKDNSLIASTFRAKLMLAGYFSDHRGLYDDMGYSIRQENIWKVSGDFPRIREKDIPEGVGDVKYSIVLSESETWRIVQEELFELIQQ